MAAVVDGIVSLVSDNPKRDRDDLRSRYLFAPTRKKLVRDGAPLREWYRASADSDLYVLVRTFTRQLFELFWEDATPGSMLTRAVGMRAFFDFLKDFLPESKVPFDPPRRETDIERTVSRSIGRALAKAKGIDFTNSFFEATGRGQARIANCFRVLNGLVSIEDLPVADQPGYQDILGT
jgi:hypothetical protein